MADDGNAAKRRKLEELIAQKQKEKEEAAEKEIQGRLQARAEPNVIDFGDLSDEEVGGDVPGDCCLFA